MEQEAIAGAPNTSPALLQRLKAGLFTSSDWEELLQQGVYLERRGVFLPWGTHLAGLEKAGGKLIAGSVLEWTLETVLGGVWVDVRIPDLLNPSGLSKIQCRPTFYQVYGEIEEGKEPEFSHLCAILGKPSLAEYSWRFGRLEIMLKFYTPNNDFYSNASYHKYIEIKFKENEEWGNSMAQIPDTLAGAAKFPLKVTADYQRWREMIFNLGPEQAGAPAGDQGYIYGVIMDIGMVDRQHAVRWAISLSAFPSGEASFHPTVGGGVSGLGEDIQVAQAAQEIVKIAPAFLGDAVMTAETPLPEVGFVQFFFLTKDGKRMFKGHLEDLQQPGNPYMQLLNMFGVIRDFAEQFLN